MSQPYYERGGIQIWHGDCREVLPTLEAGSIDLVLTDPPYGDVTHQGARTVTSSRTLIDFASITASELSDIYRLAAEPSRAWLVATMEWRHIAAIEACPPQGWRFVRFGVWVKPNGAPQFTGDRPGTGWEGIAFLHRDGRRMRWNGGGRHAVFTDFKQQASSGRPNLHPAEKPLTLWRDLVLLFSQAGDLILDPFGGSMTTAVAAQSLGRRCICVEIDERYCEIGAKRLAQMPMDLLGSEVTPPVLVSQQDVMALEVP